MSASPVARQASRSQSIPQRKVVINDASQLPTDYSTTPGGTLYSTTPGGTRIVYERAFLLQLRNSPLSRTPPKNLPQIPGILLNSNIAKENGSENQPSPVKEKVAEQKDETLEQFQLDM